MTEQLASGRTSRLADIRVLVACAPGATRTAITNRLRADGAELAPDEASAEIDALVVDTGDPHRGSLLATTDEEWDAIVDRGLLAPCRLAVGKLARLRRSKHGGSITVTCASAAAWPVPSLGAESAVQRALLMLVQMLAVEAGPHGVRVNAICVSRGDGPVHAPLAGEPSPSDLSAAVAYFVSPDSAFCNGSILVLDGGRSAAVRADTSRDVV